MSRGSRRKGLATLLAVLGFAMAVVPAGVRAQQRGAQLAPEEVIRRFTTAESQLRDARNNYTFKQDVLLQTLADAGSSGSYATGTFRRVSEIVFDDKSHRQEKITYFPTPTLKTLNVTQEDLQDLGIVQPFALTAEDLPKYDVKYIGREKVDELDTYTFDVAPKDPKGMAKRGDRYFTGRVWVEDQDYMIVKVAGKAGPEIGNNRYPHFETYRENVDGKYWFPTYTYADDVLHFEDNDVHIKMVVRYTDYKQFTGNITVLPDDNPPQNP
jgi:hypothetical protein